MNRLIAFIVFISVFACKTEIAKVPTSIKDDVAFLASDSLEGRATGSDGEKIAATYIANRFKDIYVEGKGTDGFFQEFSFKPKTGPHEDVEFTTNTDGTITGRNVIGYIDNKAENTIVIGAHYDHLGFGDEGSLHRGDKAIHNGADDNASGVAVMLHLANRLM
jgi:Zn-dependent M28 family amino/carboxypeptidase